MKGRIALASRIGLIFIAGILASNGLATFDAEAGTVTVQIDQIAELIGSGGALVAALFWRNRVKKAGGVT